jgi:hypothetical protein
MTTKEEQKIYLANWRRNNREKVKEYTARFMQKRKANGPRTGEHLKMSEASKEKALARQKIWQQNNRSACVAATMRHRSRNKAACDEYRRKYSKLNAGRLNAHTAMHQANERNAVGDGINSSLVSVFYQAAARIQKCTGIPHDVDHVHPISRGGLHHQSNIQILTHKLNMKKRETITTSPIYFPAFNDSNPK